MTFAPLAAVAAVATAVRTGGVPAAPRSAMAPRHHDTGITRRRRGGRAAPDRVPVPSRRPTWPSLHLADTAVTTAIVHGYDHDTVRVAETLRAVLDDEETAQNLAALPTSSSTGSPAAGVAPHLAALRTALAPGCGALARTSGPGQARGVSSGSGARADDGDTGVGAANPTPGPAPTTNPTGGTSPSGGPSGSTGTSGDPAGAVSNGASTGIAAGGHTTSQGGIAPGRTSSYGGGGN